MENEVPRLMLEPTMEKSDRCQSPVGAKEVPKATWQVPKPQGEKRKKVSAGW